jgi:hypothetical protein
MAVPPRVVTVLGTSPGPAAPGLVFRTDADRTSKYTVAKYSGLLLDGRWCFNPVGSLEVATTSERLADLKRRHGWATSWGVRGFLRTPHECADLRSRRVLPAVGRVGAAAVVPSQRGPARRAGPGRLGRAALVADRACGGAGGP